MGSIDKLIIKAGKGASAAVRFISNNKKTIGVAAAFGGIVKIADTIKEKKAVQKAKTEGFKEGYAEAVKTYENKHADTIKKLKAVERDLENFKEEAFDTINYLTRTINSLEDKIKMKDRKIEDLEDYILFIKKLKKEKKELIKKYGMPS